MKLQFFGCKSTNTAEWFWDFNTRFYNLLIEKGFELEDPPEFTGGNYPSANVFGNTVTFNINNLLIANPRTEKAVLFTTFYDLVQVAGRSYNLPTENMLKIYSGHYDDYIVQRDTNNFKDIVEPWYFRPWKAEANKDGGYTPENCYNPSDNILYFRGLYIPGPRDVLKTFEEHNIENIDIKSTKDPEYTTKLKTHGIFFSISGIRDMCNRDVEYWRAGLPFIRPRFTSKLRIDIPDDVYIPVEFEPNYTRAMMPIPANNGELFNSIVDKYNEVKDNTQLLRSVAENGYNFYNEHFRTEKILSNSFNLLESSGLLD